MLQANATQFIGASVDGGYVGYISEDSLFLVISYDDGVTQEQGDRLISNIQIHFPEEIKSLSDFDAKISDLILKSNLPAHFSLSAGYVKDSVIFLKTIGKGQIYVRRGKNFTLLIEGTKSASGYIRQFDCFTFTTARLYELYGNIKEIEAIIDHRAPGEIIQELEKENFTEDEKKGLVSLFVEFVHSEEQPSVQNFVPVTAMSPQNMTIAANPVSHNPVDPSISPPPTQTPSPAPFVPMRAPSGSAFRGIMGNKQKMITFGGVAVIFIILLWSVVFGYQRRANAQLDKKIATSKEVINKKLTEAEDSAFLSLDKSMNLIKEAKGEYEKVKKEVGTKRPEEMKELAAMIESKENSIVKKEEKNYQEFYDLTLEDKEATGSKIYLDGENAAILDSKNGAVYVLSLPKKSVDKNSSTDAKDATLVALDGETVYFFKPGTGILTFTSDTKTKKVISEDSDWGDVADIHIYGGNIYALDKGKDQIYKYVPVESGFSEKSSYFQSGQSIELGSASSLAIDSSVYIAVDDIVAKYTRGSREQIKTAFPEGNVSINKVYTNSDIEKVYAWNKNSGVIYILGKDGTYEKQVKSNILMKANDLTIFNNAAYILSGQKIYKMDLN